MAFIITDTRQPRTQEQRQMYHALTPVQLHVVLSLSSYQCGVLLLSLQQFLVDDFCSLKLEPRLREEETQWSCTCTCIHVFIGNIVRNLKGENLL